MVNKLQKIVLDNLAFLIPWIVFEVAAIIIIFSNNRFELHLLLNSLHNPTLDKLFIIITELGSGLAVLLVFLTLLFFNIKNALFVGLSGMFSGLTTQFFKRVIFNDYMRPAAFIEKMPNLQFVDGVDLHHAFSFPSGHTTSAFALLFSISVLSKNKIVKIICFATAVLIAYSRIYISQHFINDIVAGSFVGVIITFVMALMIFSKRYDKLNRPLIKRKE